MSMKILENEIFLNIDANESNSLLQYLILIKYKHRDMLNSE